MKPKGVFIYVDDDKDDHELFRLALSQVCDNKVLSAYDGQQGFELIENHKNDIFVIICDVHMPKITGLELKRMIEFHPVLKLKAIPFIYHTSVDDPVLVKEAYALGIQGYMLKESSFQTMVNNLTHFIQFWNSTLHPKHFMSDINIAGLP